VPLPVAQPPTGTPPLGESSNHKIVNMFSSVWLQWLVALWTSVRGPANTTAPVNSASVGIAGQIAQDANFLYVYNGTTKTWKRIALSSF